uniref:Arrestin C-terminal-like domain-containing protein n=1 Tax=Timema genevievae TaxID=629358 RepID=A0A7R9PQP5_TIMGE|nr:unnamed protein product [Timema genevievae]
MEWKVVDCLTLPTMLLQLLELSLSHTAHHVVTAVRVVIVSHCPPCCYRLLERSLSHTAHHVVTALLEWSLSHSAHHVVVTAVRVVLVSHCPPCCYSHESCPCLTLPTMLLQLLERSLSHTVHHVVTAVRALLEWSLSHTAHRVVTAVRVVLVSHFPPCCYSREGGPCLTLPTMLLQLLEWSLSHTAHPVRVVLRGKAHAEWKVVVSGDRRTVKDDQYFLDDRAIIWGKDKPEGNVPILPRGLHQFPFRFQLPESSLPCSFESKPGFIRYYIKVTVDIPYASPPQGMKYFTVIGPHIDCMDEQYLLVSRNTSRAVKLSPARNVSNLLEQVLFPTEHASVAASSKASLMLYTELPMTGSSGFKSHLSVLGEVFTKLQQLSQVQCDNSCHTNRVTPMFRVCTQKPMVGQDKRTTCCLCCEKGPVVLMTQLERSAYVCGESVKLRANIDNQGEEVVKLKVKLIQYVEYFIDRGVLGVNKELQHLILEYRGDAIRPNSRSKWDSAQSLVVPVMPPTLVGVCRLLQIYYVLKVNLEFEKSGDDLQMHFPITIATVPFRIPNSNQQPVVHYEVACEHVEGGLYIGPEFLLGQVYDGSNHQETRETVVLYRPVYVSVVKNTAYNCIVHLQDIVTSQIHGIFHLQDIVTSQIHCIVYLQGIMTSQIQLHRPPPGHSDVTDTLHRPPPGHNDGIMTSQIQLHRPPPGHSDVTETLHRPLSGHSDVTETLHRPPPGHSDVTETLHRPLPGHSDVTHSVIHLQDIVTSLKHCIVHLQDIATSHTASSNFRTY